MIELHSGEEIKLIVRKHWFLFLGQIFFMVAVFFFPFLMFALIKALTSSLSVGWGFSFSDILTQIPVIFLILLWCLVMWMWVFVLWTDYYLDAWVITNKRIVSVDQKGFFRRQISTFRMERVQDITTEVGGIIPTFFNFGNITVHTAGEGKSFKMLGAPAPTNVKEIISALIEGNRSQELAQEQGL